MTEGRQKFDVDFQMDGVSAFRWIAVSTSAEEARERAERAWSGIWRALSDGHYDAPDRAQVTRSTEADAPKHIRWEIARTFYERSSKGARIPAHDQIKEVSRTWSRSLLARDPRSRPADFTPRSERRGLVEVNLNCAVGTTGKTEASILVGMPYDFASSPETVDAVMACAMAVMLAKVRWAPTDLLISPANPLFWEQGSATLRAACIARMQADSEKGAQDALDFLSKAGFGEIADAYPWSGE